MIFAHPWAFSLAALVLLSLAVAYYFQRWNQVLPFPANSQFWRQGQNLKTLAGRWFPLAARGIALFLIVFSLARPQKISSTLKGFGEGIDIMLTIDSSLSMGSIDIKPSRIEAAKQTAIDFVLGRVQDRIGLVTFGGAPELLCPLTLDYSALISQIKTLEPGITQTDGTAIGDGIVSALNHLKQSHAKTKIIILLTDGRSNTGAVDPVTAARAAASLGVKIYAIGTARHGPALMPVHDPNGGTVMVRMNDDIDDELLTQIAQLTGGQYFRVTNADKLKEVYATIGKLQKSKVKIPPTIMRTDLYRIPVLLAVLVLLSEILLSNTWLLRWP